MHTHMTKLCCSLFLKRSGNLLLSASTEGHTFHVFLLLPHPLLSSETAVHHLYSLYRGATYGVVSRGHGWDGFGGWSYIANPLPILHWAAKERIRHTDEEHFVQSIPQPMFMWG